jgi:hypothetical protein
MDNGGNADKIVRMEVGGRMCLLLKNGGINEWTLAFGTLGRRDMEKENSRKFNYEEYLLCYCYVVQLVESWE